MNILITILNFFLILGASYLVILFLMHDFSVQTLSIGQFLRKWKPKKVLVIYPHPDDETFASGALAGKLIRRNVDVTFVTVTVGEKGDEILKLPENELAEVRRGE